LAFTVLADHLASRLTHTYPAASVTILEFALVHSLHYAPRLCRSSRVALVSHLNRKVVPWPKCLSLLFERCLFR
jgi:hypothetical protein